MSKRKHKIEYALIVFTVLLFVFISLLSFYTINNLQGTAHVINYVGMVRGVTQKLVKQELMGHPDNALISRLDSIINELITGEGPDGLIALRDRAYIGYMLSVRSQWAQLQDAIYSFRDGGDPLALYDLSQDFFLLADKAVTSAESYSEAQVKRSKSLMLSVNAIFILSLMAALIHFLRSLTIRRKADHLGKIAYMDQLTQMPNRACFERSVSTMQRHPPHEDIAVFMFDMNNLKQTNDHLGHQRGDALIAEFGQILSSLTDSDCMAYRYGGDEFVAVLKDAHEQKIKQYMEDIEEKVKAHNTNRLNEMEKISFAAGYVSSNLSSHSIAELIHEADRLMYIRKRQMKEADEVICPFSYMK